MLYVLWYVLCKLVLCRHIPVSVYGLRGILHFKLVKSLDMKGGHSNVNKKMAVVLVLLRVVTLPHTEEDIKSFFNSCTI